MSGQETYQAGFAALQAGDLTTACAAFEDVLEATPRHVGALTYLGVALARRGQWDLAEERLALACELDPVSTLPRYNLGRLYRLSSRPAEACDCFRAVLSLDRRHAGARRELAALAHADPLLAVPPQGDLAVLEIEAASSLVHTLWLAVATSLPALLAGAVAVAVTGDGACWWPAAVLAALCGGVPLAFALCVLAGYPLVARKRAPMVLELQPEGDLLRLRALDGYAVARFASAVAMVCAAGFLFFGLPALAMSLAFMEGAGTVTGSAGLAARSLLGAILGVSAGALLPLAGCTYLGTMSLAGLYNLLAQRTGGVRGRHRYHLRYSEWQAWDVGASWPSLSALLLPPALLASFVLGLVAVSSDGQVWLAAATAVPCAAVLGPPLGMVLYNLVAKRFGGLRLALTEE